MGTNTKLAISKIVNETDSITKRIYLENFLQKLNYPDISRISNEITTHWENREVDQQQTLLRLLDGEPWEYIRGYSQFLGKDFTVTPDVLIPRVETEILVQEAIGEAKKLLSEDSDSKLLVYDIGTGSGAIGVSFLDRLYEEFSERNINMIFTDISEDALKIAHSNAVKILSQKTLELCGFQQVDLIDLHDLGNRLSESLKVKLLILSNPPYIPTQQIKSLDRSVTEFEPHLALDGGKDGMELVNRLIDKMTDINHSPTTLIIEGLEDTKSLVPNHSRFRTIEEFADQYERARFIRIEL